MSNKRRLLDGTEVDSFDVPVELIIHTKAPEKWKLIDMETGQEYIGCSQPHDPFSEILRGKVVSGKIGTWTKIKGRSKNEHGL